MRGSSEASSPSRKHSLTDRSASHAAAALPSARPVTRPPSRPAITPPTVVSRPLSEADRAKSASDAVEVYAPAPPSAEPPPGERAERPGQYSIGRARPTDVALREQTGRVAVPAGLGRPRPLSERTVPNAAPSAAPNGPAPRRESSSMRAVPQPIGHEPSSGTPRPGAPSRPPTSPTPIPPASRTASPGNPGVVMTRPAVIVGAPPKGNTPTPQRVRKAREDEGRSFGQGLISEKSLDEVILAYLSEDAEEK